MTKNAACLFMLFANASARGEVLPTMAEHSPMILEGKSQAPKGSDLPVLEVPKGPQAEPDLDALIDEVLLSVEELTGISEEGFALLLPVPNYDAKMP